VSRALVPLVSSMMSGGMGAFHVVCGSAVPPAETIGRADDSTAEPASTPAQFEAMVVRTIHSQHLVQPGDPLVVLRSRLDAFGPDLVLVEARPEAFEHGRLEDGPFEMTYVTLLARLAGRDVAPIDWWREEDVGAETPAPDEVVEAWREGVELRGACCVEPSALEP
jgi:hypothetical protein